jgi:hypothetical protein
MRSSHAAGGAGAIAESRKAWFFAAMPQKMRHSDRKKINAALPRCLPLLVFCLFFSARIGALGSSEKTGAANIREYTLSISGVVRLTGNDPFPRLVVSADDGKNYIVDGQAPAREEILAMQGRRVFMETLVREYPVYAGKEYLGTEYVIFPAHCNSEE